MTENERIEELEHQVMVLRGCIFSIVSWVLQNVDKEKKGEAVDLLLNTLYCEEGSFVK